MATLRHVSDNGRLEPFSAPGSRSFSLEGCSSPPPPSPQHPGQRTFVGDVFLWRKWQDYMSVFRMINPDEPAKQQERKDV